MSNFVVRWLAMMAVLITLGSLIWLVGIIGSYIGDNFGKYHVLVFAFFVISVMLTAMTYMKDGVSDE